MSRSDRLYETLDMHLTQMEWTKHPSASEWMEDFITSEDMRGESGENPGILAPQMTGAKVMGHEYNTLNRAQTYYVEQDMLDMVTYASLSAPGDLTLESTDLPSLAGFVVFEQAVIIRDSKGQHLALGGLSWDVDNLYFTDPKTPTTREEPGVRLFLYTDPWDERDSGHVDITESLRRARQSGLPVPPFLPVHIAAVPFGNRPLYEIKTDEDPGWSDEHGYVIVDSFSFILSFFKLIVQEIAALGQHRPSRPEMRRAKRLGHIPMDGMIRTVVLRHAKPKAARTDDDREPIEWSHRWLVRGHWRNILTKEGPRTVWVNPHIKPNDDTLPLVIKDLVYDWRR